MKLLLDENLPHRLRLLLIGHECFTTAYMGWRGVENGRLLRNADAEGFDALISNDKVLKYEQNQSSLPISVIVILAKDNRIGTIEAFVPKLLEVIKLLTPKSFVKIEGYE